MTHTEFHQEVASLRSSLVRLSRKFTFDRDHAADLVQDTMLRALVNREKFHAGTNLKGWLFTIMRNLYINEYRKKLRSKVVMHEAVSLELRNCVAQEGHSPDKKAEYAELCTVIEYIPAAYAGPFRMYFSGYRYEEISELLNLPMGTVKNRIFLARKMMQERLSRLK